MNSAEKRLFGIRTPRPARRSARSCPRSSPRGGWPSSSPLPVRDHHAGHVDLLDDVHEFELGFLADLLVERGHRSPGGGTAGEATRRRRKSCRRWPSGSASMQQRRLAARAAEQREQLVLRDRQVHVVDGGAVAEFLHDVLDAYEGVVLRTGRGAGWVCRSSGRGYRLHGIHHSFFTDCRRERPTRGAKRDSRATARAGWNSARGGARRRSADLRRQA